MSTAGRVPIIWHQAIDLSEDSIAELVQCDRIIHLKGFASGIDFSHPHNVEQKVIMLRDILSACEGSESCAVIFDGDSYHPMSFTHLVSVLPVDLNSISFEFWATVRSPSEADRFDMSWHDRPHVQKLNVIPSLNLKIDCNYEILGIQTLISSKSTLVFCAGGGECILMEQAAAAERGVNFRVYDFIRVNANKELERYKHYVGYDIVGE